MVSILCYKIAEDKIRQPPIYALASIWCIILLVDNLYKYSITIVNISAAINCFYLALSLPAGEACKRP